MPRFVGVDRDHYNARSSALPRGDNRYPTSRLSVRPNRRSTLASKRNGHLTMYYCLERSLLKEHPESPVCPSVRLSVCLSVRPPYSDRIDTLHPSTIPPTREPRNFAVKDFDSLLRSAVALVDRLAAASARACEPAASVKSCLNPGIWSISSEF